MGITGPGNVITLCGFFPTDIRLIRLKTLYVLGFHPDFPRQQFRALGPAIKRHFHMATGKYHGRQLAVHLLFRHDYGIESFVVSDGCGAMDPAQRFANFTRNILFFCLLFSSILFSSFILQPSSFSFFSIPSLSAAFSPRRAGPCRLPWRR